VGGACFCGDGGAPCTNQLTCVNGQCVCVADNCSGCCSGNQCVSGTTLTACANSGACVDCGATANACCKGVCSCSLLQCVAPGSACPTGKRCSCGLTGCSCQ
jgi:hypothetical protein